MALFDLPLVELQQYRPPRREPDDFAAFWARTLAETHRYPLEARFQRLDAGLSMVDVYDVRYAGFGGQPVRGWFLLPAESTDPLPCVVRYLGYGDGRGAPHRYLMWPCAGYATLVMDTRGQGAAGSGAGATDDPAPGAGSHSPGFLTRGILDPEAYYYRRVYADAVRAVEAARAHPLVDPSRVVLAGASQGGGIALAVAGLVPDICAAVIDVPFLCHFSRALEVTEQYPYGELLLYLRTHRHHAEAVLTTLSYVDGLNFAARAGAPALFSVGLMDDVCPPSTVYAAYHHYAGAKQLQVWPYARHEGGATDQELLSLRFLGRLTGAGRRPAPTTEHREQPAPREYRDHIWEGAPTVSHTPTPAT